MVSPSKRKFIRGKPFVNKEERSFYKSKVPYKPLLNKRFYLDVKNYKGGQNLRNDLIHLGGIVEDFLVKDVNYVITIQNLNPSSRGSSSEQQSPFTPSPVTPQPPSFLSTSCDSPNLDSPKEEGRKKAKTRAEALLDRACIKRRGTSDVVENARLWGIPVWPLSKLLKWLSGLKLSSLYQPPKKDSPIQKRTDLKSSNSVHPSKSRKLKAPFLKIEGFSREFRPHFKELNFWPMLNLNCSEGVSPFADPKVTQPEVKASSNHKDNFQERQKSRQTRVQFKGGFCELCSSNYSDLKLHLQSNLHIAFVKDRSNYSKLDELINEYALKNLGETVYSGPPILSKRNNVSVSETSASTAESQQQENALRLKLTQKENQSDHLHSKTQDCNPKSPCSNFTNKALNIVPKHETSSVVASLESVQYNTNDPSIGDEELPVRKFKESLLNIDLKLTDPHQLIENYDSNQDNETQNGLSCDVHQYKDNDFNNLINNNKLKSVTLREKDSNNTSVLELSKAEPSLAFQEKNSALNSEMVRLIQDPLNKLDHGLRRGMRGPKRIQSADCIDFCSDNNDLRKHKLGKKCVRTRCQSERSDSELSDDLHRDDIRPIHPDMVEKLGKCRKPKNCDSLIDEHNIAGCNSGEKLNGEFVTQTLNGVDKLKARRASRTSSDDSDSVLSAKVNGVDIDNDRVDINLLLEISAKDRKRFENKKAKKVRKTADWMLITETEHYYNEKEEILRNKLKDDSDSESSELSESLGNKSTSLSNTKESQEKCKSMKKANSENKPPVEFLDNSRSKNALSNKGRNMALSKNKNQKKSLIDSATVDCEQSAHKVEETDRSSRSKSRLCPKEILSKLSSYDNSQIADRESLFDSDECAGSSPDKNKSDKLNSSDDKNTQIARKRLSDAERFLRDNKEYYRFPETRDRLRRNISYGKEHDLVDEQGSSNDSCNCELETCEYCKQTKESMKSQQPLVSGDKALPKCKKGKKSNESDLEKKLTSESLQVNEIVELKSNIDDGEVGDKVVDSLYFSFEGAPLKESWYQTYQRYIDGIEDENFEFVKEPLRFILPYEMPKEYFKELHARSNLLARKRIELADLVRKSPRCHASTLALFSDLFPGKKKKKSSLSKVKAIKSEEASSDGTNTPVQELVKFPCSEHYETDEELLFIGHCMEQVIKETINENQEETSNVKGKKGYCKKASKKKAKGKKLVTNFKISKFEFPSEVKSFDNNLAAEIDTCFLQNLPQYLNEFSVTPDDTFDKLPIDVMADSCLCECNDKNSCDELSSADERTEVSSESLSLCGSETVDSSNSSFPSKFRKFGPYKKRKKNMTGWPKQKRRKPVLVHISDDNDSALGFDDREPKKRNSRKIDHIMPSCNNVNDVGNDRRASARIKSSVFYMDSWPLRFRNSK